MGDKRRSSAVKTRKTVLRVASSQKNIVINYQYGNIALQIVSAAWYVFTRPKEDEFDCNMLNSRLSITNYTVVP